MGIVEQVGPERRPGTTVVHERLPGQPVVDGVVREDKVVEAGGVAEKKGWRIDDNSHDESQQAGKPERKRL